MLHGPSPRAIRPSKPAILISTILCRKCKPKTPQECLIISLRRLEPDIILLQLQLRKVNVIQVLVHHLGNPLVVFLTPCRVHWLTPIGTPFAMIKVTLQTSIEVLVACPIGVDLGGSVMVSPMHAKI